MHLVSEINTFSIFATITTTTMIQRIQSVHLGLAALFSGLMFVFPLYSVGETSYRITAGAQYSMVLCMLAGATIGLPLATIFQYKKRSLQLILCRINQLLLAGLLVACVMSLDTVRKASSLMQPDLKMSIFLPILGILLTILAMRAIKRDDALVRSADRIR